MPVSQILKDHIGKFQFNNENAAAFHKSLLSIHPEAGRHFGGNVNVPELQNDPRFQYIGLNIIQNVFNLALAEDNFEGIVRSLVISHQRRMIPLEDFKKGLPAVLKMMEDYAGGCNEEQKREWTALFERCYSAMAQMGYK